MSSPTIIVRSQEQLDEILSKNIGVVADFHAVWCGPCKVVAPTYEKLSTKHSAADKFAFVKIDVDECQEVSRKYDIRAMPTFVLFKNGQEFTRVMGAMGPPLTKAVTSLAEAVDSAPPPSASGSSSSTGGTSGLTSGAFWVSSLPSKGFSVLNADVDRLSLELLNANTAHGSIKTLLSESKPGLSKGTPAALQDYVESDTDDQLMLYLPFNSVVKIHSLQLTSLCSKDASKRPKKVKLYQGVPQILGFEEADGQEATQEFELGEKDWDEEGNSSLALRFVKFQKVTSLVIYIVGSEGGETVRLDRIRVVGEQGEKREMGKLEKVGHDHD